MLMSLWHGLHESLEGRSSGEDPSSAEGGKKSTGHHTGATAEDHGQPSQGVGQTVPSITHDLSNVEIYSSIAKNGKCP